MDSGKQKEETLDAQMEQLQIGGGDSHAGDETSLLEEAIKLAAAEKEALEAGAGEKKESPKTKGKIIRPCQCGHGYVPGEDHFTIDGFAQTFWSTFNQRENFCNLAERMRAAYEAVHEKYPGTPQDTYKVKLVVALYLSQGTQMVLQGDLQSARLFAFLAYHFQDYIAVYLDENKATIDTLKQVELLRTDEHTLVKYLRKNIPCSCLDEKYKEVKSVTKMGVCDNLECSLPKHMAKRSKMLYCNGCRVVSYCSRECQKAAWPKHKEHCEVVGTFKAEEVDKYAERMRSRNS